MHVAYDMRGDTTPWYVRTGDLRQVITRKKETTRMSTCLRTCIAQCVLAAACLIATTATPVNADDSDTTTKVSGVISKIQPGRILVTTS